MHFCTNFLSLPRCGQEDGRGEGGSRPGGHRDQPARPGPVLARLIAAAASRVKGRVEGSVMRSGRPCPACRAGPAARLRRPPQPHLAALPPRRNPHGKGRASVRGKPATVHAASAAASAVELCWRLRLCVYRGRLTGGCCGGGHSESRVTPSHSARLRRPPLPPPRQAAPLGLRQGIAATP